MEVLVKNPWGRKFIHLSYHEKCAYRAWKAAGKPDEWQMMEADTSTGHLAGEVLGYPVPFLDWYGEVSEKDKLVALQEIPYWNLAKAKLYDCCENVTLERKNTSLSEQWRDMLKRIDKFPERMTMFWLYLKEFGLQFEGEKKDVGEFLRLETSPNQPPDFVRHGGISATIVKDKLPNKYMRMIEFWDGSMTYVYTHPKWKFHQGRVWVNVDEGSWDTGRYNSLGEYNSRGVRLK